MASINPENLLQFIKSFPGDKKEPNVDYINPEWPRISVISMGGGESIGDRQPISPFITRRSLSDCVSPRLYELSTMRGLMQQFLNHPVVRFYALREGYNEVYSAVAGSSIALMRFDPMDLVPHPFLNQEGVGVNGLFSNGTKVSLAHTETIGGGGRATL